MRTVVQQIQAFSANGITIPIQTHWWRTSTPSNSRRVTTSDSSVTFVSASANVSQSTVAVTTRSADVVDVKSLTNLRNRTNPLPHDQQMMTWDWKEAWEKKSQSLPMPFWHSKEEMDDTAILIIVRLPRDNIHRRRSFDWTFCVFVFSVKPAAQRVEDICVSMIGLIIALIITALLALVAVAIAVSCWLMAYRRRPKATGPLPHPPEFPNPLFTNPDAVPEPSPDYLS